MIDIWHSFDKSHSSNWEMARRFLDGCNISFNEDLVDVLRERPWTLQFDGDVDAIEMHLIQGFRPKSASALALGLRAARGVHKSIEPFAYIQDEGFYGGLVTDPVRMEARRFIPGFQTLSYGVSGLQYEQRRPSETVLRTESFTLSDNGLFEHNRTMSARPESPET